MKTVVLGGYGNFGARICRALANCSDIDLIVAGRNADSAKAFAAGLGCGAQSMRLDCSSSDFVSSLRSIGAELVIHTAGPFQNQGFDVAIAVAAAGANYIDLADGRRFVCDFKQATDAAFLECGKLAITGASTVPALSSAVIDFLSRDWTRIDTIEFCIAPAQSAPRGVATMAAVLNYCGAPIQVWQDGQWKTQYGWEDTARIDFERLHSRLGALCDIPDLELFPTHYQGVRTVIFRAALEVGLTQRALSMMATLRRKGIIQHPERLAKFLNASAHAFDFLGSALGGMVVRVAGADKNSIAIRKAWHIAADNDHGPEIPCMAAIILARKIAKKELSQVGAHTSIGWLDLSEFQPEFEKWGMVTDVVGEEDAYGT